MIVRRGNDSSTWNLMAGAWNKLRDGWFALCHALGGDGILEKQCFGKIMRLMAADVAMWHRSAGSQLHTDTDVWAELPLPWKVLTGDADCPRALVESTCGKYGIDPYKNGWIARRAEKRIETFTPTPELVHGIVVSSPQMAKAMRRAGIFSGKVARLDGSAVDLDQLIDQTIAARADHYETEMTKFEEKPADAHNPPER